MTEQLTATFMASLPSIQGAVRFGDGSCRAQLDIPESDLHEAIKLTLMSGKRLRVTVEVMDDADNSYT